jgi:hypothetical protein
MVLYDLYETHYRIYNHLNSTKVRPLAGVALHESEDNSHGSRLYELIDTFADKEIGTLFNISIIEFLALPTEYCLKLIDTANKTMQRKSAMMTNLGNSFDVSKRP